MAIRFWSWPSSWARFLLWAGFKSGFSLSTISFLFPIAHSLRPMSFLGYRKRVLPHQSSGNVRSNLRQRFRQKQVANAYGRSGRNGFISRPGTLWLASPNARSFQYKISNDGSTLVTNAALRTRPSIDQRHQFDYGFRWPELQAVDFTATSNGSFFLLEVDATTAGLASG